jgi:hypothetical protein
MRAATWKDKARDWMLSLQDNPAINALGLMPTGGVGMAGIAIPKDKMWFHGTTKTFRKFNPRYNDPTDLFGSMTHAAADPKYAAEYTNLDNWDYLTKQFGPHATTSEINPFQLPRSQIIPANARVKNAIDVSSNDPNAVNWKDLAELHKSNIDLSYSKDKDLFPQGIKGTKSRIPKNLELMAEDMLKRGGKDYTASTHGAGKAPNKVPRDYLEKLLANQPLALKDAGFDGIVYADNIATAKGLDPTVLAVQNPSQLVSPYSGKPLGLNVKPENLGRVVDPYGQLTGIEPKLGVRNFDETQQELAFWQNRLAQIRKSQIKTPIEIQQYTQMQDIVRNLYKRLNDKPQELLNRFSRRGR